MTCIQGDKTRKKQKQDGGKGGTGPSSLHTTLEGPTELCECEMVVKSTWHQIMIHGHLDYFQKPSRGG